MKRFELKQIRTGLIHCALLLIAAGCSSDTTIGTKSFEETVEFTIPQSPIPISGTLPTLGIPVKLTDQPGYEDGDFDYVTSVKIRDIVFEITPQSSDMTIDTTEDGNLDSFEFVSSLDLGLSAILNGTQTAVDIAELPENDPQIASNLTTLNMRVMDVEIRDLIEAPDGSNLQITISGRTPPDAVMISARIRYRVGIGFR